MRIQEVTLDNIVDLNHKVKSIELCFKDDYMRHKPGQYLKIHYKDGKEYCYSIADVNMNNKFQLHISVNRNNEFSDYLNNKAKPGDVLNVSGPYGELYKRERDCKEVVYVAEGTGFASIKSIIESSLKDDTRQSLFWYNKDKNGIYMEDKLKKWKNEYCNFSYKILNEAEDKVEYITNSVVEQHKKLSECVVYVCGSQNLNKYMKTNLVMNGLNSTDYYTEI